MFGQILAKRVVTLEFSRMMGQAGKDFGIKVAVADA